MKYRPPPVCGGTRHRPTLAVPPRRGEAGAACRPLARHLPALESDNNVAAGQARCGDRSGLLRVPLVGGESARPVPAMPATAAAIILAAGVCMPRSIPMFSYPLPCLPQQVQERRGHDPRGSSPSERVGASGGELDFTPGAQQWRLGP